MTGRTHDLAALTALHIAFLISPPTSASIGTVCLAIIGATLGGIIPDLDQHTSDSWDRLPAGSIVSKLFYRIFGGHRSISHSLLGVLILSVAIGFVLQFFAGFMMFDHDIVWAAVGIGMVSHLIMDTFTVDGVPWLLPLKTKFGFPPMKLFRIKTAGKIEALLIYPGLIVLNGYLFVRYYPITIAFLRGAIQ